LLPPRSALLGQVHQATVMGGDGIHESAVFIRPLGIASNAERFAFRREFSQGLPLLLAEDGAEQDGRFHRLHIVVVVVGWCFSG
jgi:hypothetical protein